MGFKKWLISEDFRTGTKLGLYPDLADALGQHPPLYGMAKSADFITYLYLKYGDQFAPPNKDGIIAPRKQKFTGTEKLPPA